MVISRVFQKVWQQGDIEVDPRVVWEQAKQTVKSLIDGIVELVTNSDDSYRRINQAGGNIQISVKRLKGGKWEFLEISDNAEGMQLETLKNALRYGTQSSGFEKGQSVRGLWGRGLKETILALGEGHIETIHNRKLSTVRVWWDPESKRAKWQASREEKVDRENSTTITVFAHPETTVKCPEFDKLYEQICSHYALRDIIETRDVWLTLHSIKGRGKSSRPSRDRKRLRFGPVKGALVLEEQIKKSSVGPLNIRIYESTVPLGYARFEPYSKAGILIRTEGIPLDISLFGHEDEAGRFFFGEVECPKLAEEIRKDLSILTSNRTGLAWRHPTCRDLDGFMKSILEPLVTKKRAQLKNAPSPSVPSLFKNKLLKILNKLAAEELEESSDNLGSGSDPALEELSNVIIKPEHGIAEPEKARRFTIYAPYKSEYGTLASLKLIEPKGFIRLSEQNLELTSHPTNTKVMWGHFYLVGGELGDNAWVSCQLGNEKDTAYFEVKEGKGGPKQPRGKGGFFKDIRPSLESDPLQRVAYSNGDIIYYTEFPVIKQFIQEDKFKSDEGKVLFAEIVSEAVCNALARKRIDDGLLVGRSDSDIVVVDRFNAEVHRLQKRCLQTIHQWANSYDIDLNF